MLSRKKSYSFKFEGIFFENNDTMEKFLNDFKSVYGDFIYIFDGKVLNIFNKNNKLKTLKINISINPELCIMSINGKGIEELVISLELYMRKKYDLGEIICYYPWDSSQSQDDVVFGGGEDVQAKWNKEQQERVRLLKDKKNNNCIKLVR